MIQWFEGEMEASYLAVPLSAGAAPTSSGAAAHEVHVYRAVIRRVKLIEPPPVDAPPRNPEFQQSQIDDCTVVGVRGSGSAFRGPVFEVGIDHFEFSHPARHHGRAYGRMTGNLVGWCELPAPAPRAEPTTRVIEPAAAPDPVTQPETPRARQGELSFDSVADIEPTAADIEEAQTVPELEGTQSPTTARAPSTQTGTSLYLLTLAVALGIGVSGGIEAALLFCAFLVPTLLARSLFSGVLRDSMGVRAFGVVLILAQVFAVSSLVSGWWNSGCRELLLVPLLGIVAVLFPSGLLPSKLPLLCNGAGLALVLALWSSKPASACHERDEIHDQPARAPTVRDPGVPRTNLDGSWPKRPPG